MTRTYRRAARYVLIGVAAMSAGACAEGGAGGSGAGTGYDDKTVRVGVVASFSGPGASAGRQWRAGAEMAKSDIEAAGGIDGRKIELLTQDDKTEPSASVAAMRKIVSQDPFAVLGSVQSTNTVVNAKVLQDAGIPQFTASEADTITDGKNDNIFQTSLSANNQVDRLTAYIESLEPKRAALLHANTEVNVVGAEAIRSQIKKLGIPIVADMQTELEQTDYSGEVARLRRSNPDLLFLHLLEEPGGRLLPALDRAGLTRSATVIGNNVMVSGEVLDLAGESADGVRGFVEPKPDVSESVKELADRFRAKYPGESPSNNFTKGYIALQALAAAVEGSGKLDRQAVKDYLHDRTLCLSDHPGLLGSTYWDRAGRAYRESFVVEARDSKVKVIDEVEAPDPSKLQECAS